MNPLSIPLREQLINKKLNHFLTQVAHSNAAGVSRWNWKTLTNRLNYRLDQLQIFMQFYPFFQGALRCFIFMSVIRLSDFARLFSKRDRSNLSNLRAARLTRYFQGEITQLTSYLFKNKLDRISSNRHTAVTVQRRVATK